MILENDFENRDLLQALKGLEEDAFRLEAARRENGIYFLRLNRPQNWMTWSDAFIRCFFGGNRSGKTHWGVSEDISFCCGKRLYLPEDHPRHVMRFQPPVKLLLIAESWDHLQEVHVPKFYELCPKGWLEEIRRQGLVQGFKFVKGPGKGSIIRLATYDQNPRKIEGKDYHGVHFDEPPPYSHYAPITRSLVDSGGMIWLTLTLLAEGWLWDEIWLRAESGDKDYFGVVGTIYDNIYDPATGAGALKKENIDRFEKTLDDSQKQVRLYGKPQHLQGRIFKNFKPEPPWVVDEYEVPEDWPALRAFDPHQHKPIAGLWARLTKGNRIIVTDCLYDEDMPKDMDVLRARIQEIERARKHRIAMSLMDSAGGAEDVTGYSVFDHFKKFGIHCRPAKKSNKLARVMKTGELFNVDQFTSLPGIVIMKNESTARLIWELQRYTHPQVKNKYREERWKELREGADKRDDHLIDCLLYLVAEDPQYEYLQDVGFSWYPEARTPDPDPFVEHYGGGEGEYVDQWAGNPGEMIDVADYSA